MTVRRTKFALSLLPVLGTLLASMPAFALSGQDVYSREGCSVCHGYFGDGGVGARLKGDRFLNFGGYVIARILFGGGEMPAFADTLSNQNLAAVASYIRQSFGNQFGPVSPQEVSNQRHQLVTEAERSRRGLTPAGGTAGSTMTGGIPAPGITGSGVSGVSVPLGTGATDQSPGGGSTGSSTAPQTEPH